jgi:hypothetical protein
LDNTTDLDWISLGWANYHQQDADNRYKRTAAPQRWGGALTEVGGGSLHTIKM